MKQPDESIETRAKAVFDTSVSELSGALRSRLTQARFAAVAQLQRKPSAPLLRIALPAMGLTAVALIAVLVILPGMKPDMNKTPSFAESKLNDADMTLVLDADNLEFLEEVEFYAWLGNEAFPDAAPAAPLNPQAGTPATS